MPRILLADDDTMLRTVLCKILVAAGHTVFEAGSGTEAERLLSAEPVDLVITDIIMPEMEGVELVRQLKRRQPDLRIIAMSGGGRAHVFDMLDAAEQFGADMVLRKPFRRDALLEAVSSLLHRGAAPISG